MRHVGHMGRFGLCVSKCSNESGPGRAARTGRAGASSGSLDTERRFCGVLWRGRTAPDFIASVSVHIYVANLVAPWTFVVVFALRGGMGVRDGVYEWHKAPHP